MAGSSANRSSPSPPGSVIRKAFLTESIFNLFTIPLFTHPRTILGYLLARPAEINPSSIFLARLVAGLVVGALTPGLWYGATRAGAAARRPVYYMLGGGEAVLIPLLIKEALKHGDRTAALSETAAWVSVAMIGPPFLWRLYAMFVKPSIMGRADAKRE